MFPFLASFLLGYLLGKRSCVMILYILYKCRFIFKHVLYVNYKFPLLVLGLSPQAALLNSFPDIFDELLQMFTVQEVAEYVRGTLGSMPSTVDIGQSMDVVKLQSIARTVESRLFFFPGETNAAICDLYLKILKLSNIQPLLPPFFASSSESRSILLPVVLHHIHLHLRQQRELLICSGILSSIFSIIKTSSMVQYYVSNACKTNMTENPHVITH